MSNGVPKKSLRVLCAEDNTFISSLLRRGLEEAGHSVQCVGNGLAARELIASAPSHIDVVITDHEMPYITGLDLVSELRAMNFSGRIIVYSSQLRSTQAAAYRSLAVDHIFTKPAPWKQLLAAVEESQTQRPTNNYCAWP
jgi:CheY-like chemotaxis protein